MWRHLTTEYAEADLERMLDGPTARPRREVPVIPDTPGENLQGLMAAMSSGVIPR